MKTESVSSASFVNESVNSENPWLGLHPFTEELQEFFYGRDGEADELHRRVNRKTLTILFGQSGLGKTSLLRAGLFPRLRRAGFLPFTIRVVHTADAPPPAAQIISAFAAAVKASNAILQSTQDAVGASLWEYFHSVDFSLKSQEGKVLAPVVVFDQFEEVFTLGSETELLRKHGAALLTEVADLVENRAPQKLLEQFEADPESVEKYHFDNANYRVLLSLREDYLANLEDMRTRMPSLSENRMRLTRMNGEQALDAVSKPGGHLVSPAVSRQIVRFVSGAPPVDEASSDIDLTRDEVDPALLSLFCAELNNRRRAQGLSQITADLLAGSRETILQDYYERSLADVHPAVRRFVEDELLTDQGYRVDVPRERAEKTLLQGGAAADALDALVKRRLLRTEERLHVRRVELAHDVLCSVVSQSRDARRQREQVNEARLREQQIRDKLRSARKRLLILASVMAAFLAIVSAFGLFSYAQWQKAIKAEQEARRQSELAADATRKAETNAELAKANEARAKTNEDLANERSVVAEKLQDMAREYIAESNFSLSQIANDYPSVRGVQLEFLEKSVAKLDKIIEVNPQAIWARQSKAYTLAFACEAAERVGNQDAASDYGRRAIQAATNLPRDQGSLRVVALSLGLTGTILRRLEEYELAAQTLEHAHAAIDQLDPKNNEDSARLKAAFYQAQGELYDDLEQPGKRLDAYSAAIELHSKWLKVKPTDVRLREELATFQIQAGNACLTLGDVKQAIERLETAKELQIKLWRETDSAKTRNQLAYAFEQLAWAYRVDRNLEKARTAYDNMIGARRGVIFQAAGTVLPDDLVYDVEERERNLSSALQLVGSMEYKIGDPEIAKTKYEEAVTIAHDLRKRRPDLKNVSNLSVILVALGNDLTARGDWAGAEKAYREALELREDVLKARADDSVANRAAKGEVALILDRMALLQFSQEHWPEMLKLTERRVTLCREVHESKDTLITRARLASALGSLSFHALFVGQPEQARKAAEEALELKPDEAWIRTNLAHALLYLGDFEKAEAIYREISSEKLGAKSMADACREDFRLLRKAGFDNPRFAEIEAILPPPAEAAKASESAPRRPWESDDSASPKPQSIR